MFVLSSVSCLCLPLLFFLLLVILIIGLAPEGSFVCLCPTAAVESALSSSSEVWQIESMKWNEKDRAKCVFVCIRLVAVSDEISNSRCHIWQTAVWPLASCTVSLSLLARPIDAQSVPVGLMVLFWAFASFQINWHTFISAGPLILRLSFSIGEIYCRRDLLHWGWSTSKLALFIMPFKLLISLLRCLIYNMTFSISAERLHTWFVLLPFAQHNSLPHHRPFGHCG